MIGSTIRAPEYRVVRFDIGADPADLAVRQLRPTRAVRVITDRTLLRRRIQEVLRSTAGRGKWEMRSYRELVQHLWKDVHGSDPDGYSKYDAELQAFLEMLPGRKVPQIDRRPLVILEGQRLPSEFYRVITHLGISAVVGVDPGAVVTAEGSTISEIVVALGNAPLERYRGDVPATAVLELIAAVDPARRALPAGAPSTSMKPAVRCFDSTAEEAQMVVKMAAENPDDSIGVLLPTVELINDFAKRLRDAGGRFQWYHHSHAQLSQFDRITFDCGGIKLLSWASSAGLRFDQVVLPQLHYVDEQFFTKNLPVLGVTAKRELVLSYTGDGLPTALAALPSHLVDFSDATGAVGWEAGAPFRHDDPAMTRQVAPPDAEPARAVLRDDRLLPTHRQRVLTAQEEVSLALLMRGGRVPLSEELPAGYRAGLSAGDERAVAFDAMITHNLGLVRKYAGNYSTEHWDFDDLVQVGVIGLMRAVEKFDASMGLKFSTYASWWINQAIGRAMPEGLTIRVPVHMWEVARKVAAVRSRLTTSDRSPSAEEIAERAEVPVDKVVLCLEILSGVRSLDEPVRGAPDLSLWDVVISESAQHFDEVLDRREVTEHVQAALRLLGDRDADVLRLRFGFGDEDPMTLDRIGGRYSVTRERIRQIENRSKSKLREYLCGGMPARRSKSSRGARPPRRAPHPAIGQPAVPAEIDPTTLPPAIGESAADSLVRFITEQVVLSETTSLAVVFGSDDALWCRISYRGTGDSVRAVLRASMGGVQALRGLLATVDQITTLVSDHPDGIALHVRRDRWTASRVHFRLPSALPSDDEQPWTMISLSAPGVALTGVTALAAEVSTGLGVALGPRIRHNGLLVAVNGKPVPAADPFLWGNPATQDLGREEISTTRCAVTANPYVLPHPGRLREDDTAQVGDPARWGVRQGLYLRSEGRYLLWGGWWGLPGFGEHELSSLVRVDLEVEADQLPLWGFDGPGPIGPPPALVPRLAAVASVASKRSEAVWTSHRKDSA